MTEEEGLAQLAAMCGLQAEYYDIWGGRHLTTPDTQRAILRAMGLRIDSLPGLDAELRRQAAIRAHRLCDPVAVFTAGEQQAFQLAVPGDAGLVRVTAVAGEVEMELAPVAAEEVGDVMRLAPCPPLPNGLHDVILRLQASAGQRMAQVRAAVVPRRGYALPTLEAGRRAWGVLLSLYGLRSARNWGVGDFQDLLQAVEWAAGLGADMVGTLPLHALFNELPYGVSPYYPSSRLFLNPLYIAVDCVPEADSAEVQALVNAAAFQEEIARLRASELVEYESVWALKRRTLERCYREFLRRRGVDGGRYAAFEAWQQAQGTAIEDFAVFSALRDRAALATEGNWQQWPSDLQALHAAGVESFRREFPEQVGLHVYLQWLADAQLSRCQQRARELGMAVGLYLDLALGVDPCGADAWVYQDVLALGASSGAPPDPFSLMGQRWGLPPVIPARHREAGYRFFLETLRRNTARAGALRIDHVLSLWKLYWIPGDLPAACGAYVLDYPDELLGLLRLVSQEQRCLIVGEDLGTIPPEVRESLMTSGFYSYRLLLFEKHTDGRYRRPAEFPRQTLATIATHDLPPVDGFWLGTDLEVKRRLAQYPSPEAERSDAEGRCWDRLRLLEALAAEGLLPSGVEPAHSIDPRHLDALAEALHAYLARTPAALMLVNLDDLLGGVDMQNLPGTLDEHPNWRRKSVLPLESWGNCARARRIVAAVRREGRGLSLDGGAGRGDAGMPFMEAEGLHKAE
jgi:4-alpha-glucanotransferase